jgi:hypothetical protein
MNKMTFLIAFSFLLNYVVGQGTNNQTIPVNERYFKGVSFPSDYKVSFNLGAEYLTKRFTPTLQNIETFEAGFVEQLNTLDNPFRISDPKLFFKKHKRQYLGYINNKGDSIVLTQFVDRGTILSFKRRSWFSGWKEHFITCLNDFCYRYLRLYQFNLTTKKLEIP